RLRPSLPPSPGAKRLPTTELLIVDAKAAGDGFDASWPALRALVEYVKRQQHRQQGYNLVDSAVLVSSRFKQPPPTLQELSNGFLAETRIPLVFLTAETLAKMVERIQSSVDIRAAIDWKRLFAGGALNIDSFAREMGEASKE